MLSDLKIRTLQDCPHLYDEVVTLVENAFDYKEPYKFDVDFAPLMSKTNRKNCFIALIGEEVVAHVGCMERFWNIGTELSATLLGGIAVKEGHRGKGIMKTLIHQVIQWREDKTTTFILWSEKSDLYSKLQFHECGGVTQQNGPSFEGWEKKSWSLLSATEIASIRNIFESYSQKKFLTFTRSDNDWNQISQIESCDIYLKRDEADKIVAYCFNGKGFDLNNVTHEFGIDSQKETELKIIPGETVWVPEGITANRQNTIYTGLFRIGNHEKFKKLISKWSKGGIQVYEIHPERIEFIYNKNVYSESPKEFLQMLLGPSPVEAFAEILKPISIFGVDSI